MAHTKSITIGIIYRPPNQPKLNTSYPEIHFLGEFNINRFENEKYVLDKSSSNIEDLD